VVLKNGIEFFPIGLSHDSIIAPLKMGCLCLQYILFNLPYNRITYITFYTQSQWHSQSKSLGGAKKFGGSKCMILGE